MPYQQYNQQVKKKKEYQKKTKDGNNDCNIPPPKQELINGIQILKNDSVFLGNQFIKFKNAMNDWKSYSNTDLIFFEKWLSFSVQANDIDLLEGKLNDNKMKGGYEQLHKAPNEEILFKSFDFFKDYPWSARFSSIF